jgi:N-acyl-D-aspartate/D-glutamate deacylase
MRKAAALALGAVLGALAACASPAYDLLIRGGTVVDGTGAPAFEGDVAVKGDRIVKVSRGPMGAGAARVVEAKGLVVAPGFIDMHSHSDFLLLEDGRAQSKVRQGVTTEILGEDSSAGPVKGKLASPEGKPVPWKTLGGYFEALQKSGISVNVASYVGQGTVWRCVMGGSFERPTPAQLEVMQELVAEAMDDGAWGLSSMLAGPTGLLATTDDMVALCRVVHHYGGIYSSHIRNEGTEVLAAVKEAIEIGRRANVGVDIIHIKIAEQKLWGRMKEIIALIEEARSNGVNVQANVYPYTRGNNNLASIVPPWAHEGGHGRMMERLRDPAERAKMKKDIHGGIAGWYNHYTAVGGDWARMLVNANLSAKNKRFEGQTMDKVIADRTRGTSPAPDPLDVMFDFLLEEDGSVATIYSHHTEEDMNLAMKQKWCSIGSDGLAYAVDGPLRRGVPHPRSFGTFPRVLGVYAREKGLLTLEDAVRKMTSANAEKLGLPGRGVLKEGAYADLAVFDRAKVIDRATYLDPFQYPEGIEFVVVNGSLVLERGRHTGAKPGRVLRRGRE